MSEVEKNDCYSALLTMLPIRGQQFCEPFADNRDKLRHNVDIQFLLFIPLSKSSISDASNEFAISIYAKSQIMEM